MSAAETAAEAKEIGDSIKRSVGEELYLVHLSRFGNEEPDPEDYDREVEVLEKKKEEQEGHLTAGEQLWLVHCKRKQGCDDEDEDDEDEDCGEEEGKKMRASEEPVEAGKEGEAPTKKKAKAIASAVDVAGEDHVRHLRNRDIVVP